MQRMYDYQSNSRMYKDCNRQQDIKKKKCCIQPESELPECPVVAMAYIPFQECTEIYDECKALEVGTLFPSLDKPFLGGCCR